MKKLFGFLLIASFIALGGASNSWAFFIDFEDGVDGGQVMDIDGITFQSFNGSWPIYGDSRTNLYNTTSDDLGYGFGNFHHNGNFFVWAGSAPNANGIKVDFDNDDGTWFQTGYSSFSQFYIEAYMTDGSKVTANAGANLNNPMGYLRVDAAAGLTIDYVVIHDSWNAWLVDDMSGDASGIAPSPVPEPGTILLLGFGLAGLASVGRKKFKK